MTATSAALSSDLAPAERFRHFLRRANNPEVVQFYTLIILFSIVGIFLGAVTGEKTTFLYKETLHLSASSVAALNFILNIPAYVQPFLAVWTELVPWGGYRRRSYLALGVGVGVFGYLALALLPHYAYNTVIPLLLIVTTGGVIRSVIIGAVVAAVGNRTGTLPRLQTVLTMIGLTLALTTTSHLGGFIAAHWSYQAVFYTAAGLTLLKLPLLLLVPDPRVTSVSKDHDDAHAARERHREEQRTVRVETLRILRKTSRDGRFWAAIAMIAFITLTPFPGSAQIYYETDLLHFSKQFIGDLNAYSAFGAFAGLGVFFALGKRLQLRMLPLLYIALNVVVYLLFLLMHDATSAKICFTANGAIGVFLSIALTTFATRLCPRGVEGTVFAFYGTVTTVFALLCDLWGTSLYDHFGPANKAAHYTVAHGWNMSLYWGMGMMLFSFVFIPFLPLWTRSHAPLSAPAEDPEDTAQAPVISREEAVGAVEPPFVGEREYADV